MALSPRPCRHSRQCALGRSKGDQSHSTRLIRVASSLPALVTSCWPDNISCRGATGWIMVGSCFDAQYVLRADARQRIGTKDASGKLHKGPWPEVY